MKYKAVVIGSSAGGLNAVRTILKDLEKGFKVPILIVQHLSHQSENYMTKYLNEICSINVKEAEEKEKPLAGNVYIAPPNYHLLVETDGTLSLTVGHKVNYSRPSIDVLFKTAADAYRGKLIGIILTGANSDGSEGLKCIKEYGGITIVQNPNTAEVNQMPISALKKTNVDYVLDLNEISTKLVELVGGTNE